MRRNTFALGLIVVLMSVAAVAQMGPPVPGPELKKLDYFPGTWSLDATIGSGPWGGGGKFTATDRAEWMKGGFFFDYPWRVLAAARNGRFRYLALGQEL